MSALPAQQRASQAHQGRLRIGKRDAHRDNQTQDPNAGGGFERPAPSKSTTLWDVPTAKGVRR